MCSVTHRFPPHTHCTVQHAPCRTFFLSFTRTHAYPHTFLPHTFKHTHAISYLFLTLIHTHTHTPSLIHSLTVTHTRLISNQAGCRIKPDNSKLAGEATHRCSLAAQGICTPPLPPRLIRKSYACFGRETRGWFLRHVPLAFWV